MPEKWQQLHLANNGAIPPLLFKYSPTASGYALYMTDLNYIWSEHLDRKAVIKRAEKDDTTIDPSEDLEQFNVLLEKIGEALQNEPGSKTSLSSKTQGSTHDLELTVTLELPAPLKPLQWSLYLSREPQSSTTSHLLLPFINAEADREAGQQSLIEELNKKDWVLGKLFDKIDTMGIDISTIFPGTSGLRGGRKGPTLAQAAKYIKGLAPFNEQSWREEVSKYSPNVGLSANIVAEMSVNSRISGQLNSLKPPPDHWWEGLATSNDTRAHSTPEEVDEKEAVAKPSKDIMETDTDAGSETGDDDEFERQETPPRLKKPDKSLQKFPPPRKDENEETQSEDEEPNFPKRKQETKTTSRVEDHPGPAKRPKAPPTGKPKGLGTIGGKKQTQQKSPSLSPTPSLPETSSPSPSPRRKKQQPQPPEKHDDDDETTDADADTDEEPPKPQAKTNSEDTTKPAPKPARRIGVIGGKKKEPTPELEPTLETESEQEPEPEPNISNNKATQPQSKSQSPEPQPAQAPLKKKKLGVIGGQKAKDKIDSSGAEATKSSRTESISPPANAKKKQEGHEEAKKEEGPSSLSPPAPEERKLVKRETPAEREREETEEERADRKREELKRQLEAKSKAPAKKKRRF
ncbi:XRCC4-like factor-domain-containing protein [Aspergillus aurantiobrunneus]